MDILDAVASPANLEEDEEEHGEPDDEGGSDSEACDKPEAEFDGEGAGGGDDAGEGEEGEEERQESCSESECGEEVEKGQRGPARALATEGGRRGGPQSHSSSAALVGVASGKAKATSKARSCTICLEGSAHKRWFNVVRISVKGAMVDAPQGDLCWDCGCILEAFISKGQQDALLKRYRSGDTVLRLKIKTAREVLAMLARTATGDKALQPWTPQRRAEL